MAKTDELHDVIAPLVSSMGLDLYDLEMNRGILRVSLTKIGGINLDELTQANTAIGAKLDQLDPFNSRYTLEVSSPGLERTLRTPQHFAQAVGESIKIRSLESANHDRRLDGVIITSDSESVTIEDENNNRHTVAFQDIERARTTFAWGSKKKVLPTKAKIGARRHEKSEGRK